MQQVGSTRSKASTRRVSFSFDGAVVVRAFAGHTPAEERRIARSARKIKRDAAARRRAARKTIRLPRLPRDRVGKNQRRVRRTTTVTQKVTVKTSKFPVKATSSALNAAKPKIPQLQDGKPKGHLMAKCLKQMKKRR
ncbi:hypothetical protein QR680_000527 [Steinernema hermaphroditum]|uniref:Uncharacterized protein n=1 Tax=Steinernema hermaphroditum TaxID=289476 RepID=A0AA39GVR5_9BILA|nr:hypothetical protein QR680_000527 [Steinernema hermaphroditum]